MPSPCPTHANTRRRRLSTLSTHLLVISREPRPLERPHQPPEFKGKLEKSPARGLSTLSTHLLVISREARPSFRPNSISYGACSCHRTACGSGQPRAQFSISGPARVNKPHRSLQPCRERPDLTSQTHLVASRQTQLRVHSLHAAVRGSHIAMRFRSFVAFGNSSRPCRAPAIAPHLLPCSRGSRLCDGPCCRFIFRSRACAAPTSLPI